jgi:hypothetical protein
VIVQWRHITSRQAVTALAVCFMTNQQLCETVSQDKTQKVRLALGRRIRLLRKLLTYEHHKYGLNKYDYQGSGIANGKDYRYLI